jgi:hypothetical protein
MKIDPSTLYRQFMPTSYDPFTTEIIIYRGNTQKTFASFEPFTVMFQVDVFLSCDTV